MRPALSSLLLALVAVTPGSAQADYRALVAQFAQVRSQSVWPVQGGSPDDIEETFGPRRQPSAGGAYDWHRGIDIDGAHGHTIVAAYPGEFYRYTNFAAGGWTVVLKHTFPEALEYNGRALRNFYTYYMHLDDSQTPDYMKAAQANNERPQFQAGQAIATMGNSGKGPGDDYAVHLHFELRVGTPSSLEYQLATFATNSASFYGFDPHMHPLLLFQPLTNALELAVLQGPTGGQDGVILVTALNDDQPTLNEVDVNFINPNNGALLATHKLDLNRRWGFDPTSTEALDSRDKTRPYFEPLYFIDAQTNYQTRVVIPKAYADPWLTAGALWNLVARDIWGNAVQVPSPALEVTLEAGSIKVRWPVSAANLSLAASPTLAPAAWTLVSGPLAVIEDRLEIEHSIPAITSVATDTCRFFRLIEPGRPGP